MLDVFQERNRCGDGFETRTSDFFRISDFEFWISFGLRASDFGFPRIYWPRMSAALHVTPPPKPLLVYDGDCAFCLRWIRKWQRMTDDRVEYTPYQSLEFRQQYPGIRLERCEASVQFVGPDGAVYSGAEAVLRSLATASRARRWLRWYERSPLFARFAEWAYRFVASHRTFFSALTRSRKRA